MTLDNRDAIRAIIREEYRIMGEAAHRIATDLDFISIDSHGTLHVPKEPTWDQVQALIDRYAAVQGEEVAIGIADRATDQLEQREG